MSYPGGYNDQSWQEDHIPLEYVSGYNGEVRERQNPQTDYLGVHVDIDESLYLDSDDEVDTHRTKPGHNPIDELPSRKIEALGYKSIGSSVRNRKPSATGVTRSKTRKQTRRATHTHIYNAWRKDPIQLNEQILKSWRDEDEEDEEVVDELRAAQRIEELRDMTINLSRKKELRNVLRNKTLSRGGTLRPGQGITCWRGMKYAWSIRREHMKNAILSNYRSLGLWESHLKAFASNFGTDVTAYFLFLRWLFVANLIIGSFIVVFLFLPQLLYTLFFVSEDQTTGLLDPSSASVSNNYNTDNLEGGREFLTGTGNYTSGFFEDKGMYYGGYTNRIVYSFSATVTYWYNMRLAYLLVYGTYFLIFFLVLAISVAKSYRKNFIESSDKFTFQYVLKILDGWDYNVDAEKTANTKKKNTFRDLTEFCASNREPETQGNCCDDLMMFVFRAAAMFLMLIAIGGCGVGIFFALFWESKLSENAVPSLWRDMLVPIIISSVNGIVPFIFSGMASYLKFTNPKSVVYTSLIMTMLLYGTTLGVYFATTLIPCGGEQAFTKVITDVGLQMACPKCWETRLGEKAYALVLVDFIFFILFTLVTEVLHRLVSQCCCGSQQEKNKKSYHPQFDIARNTMALIYNQFLLWLGIYYHPLLTVVVVIKLFIAFWIKRVTVMNACIPTTKPWRAAKMHTIFLGLLFIGFIFCVILFGVALTVIEPSKECGPFRNLTSVTDVVADGLQTDAMDGRNRAFEIILSPGVVVGIIVLLCVIVHYVRVTSAGRKTLISLLKIQITLESKDKAYLRHMLDKVEQHYRHKTSRVEVRGCQCEGACNCAAGGDHSHDGDIVEELRPNPGRQRVFVKQRSNTANSLLSGGDLSFGSREDLSRSRTSNPQEDGVRTSSSSDLTKSRGDTPRNKSGLAS